MSVGEFDRSNVEQSKSNAHSAEWLVMRALTCDREAG